jgi:chemotaxis signal transduction protein
MEAAQVRGILPLSELVPMPSMRPGLLGIVTLGRRVVNVIDLSSKLRLPASRPGCQPKIVVLEVTSGDHRHMAGFIADRVSDVVVYPARNLHRGVLRGTGRPRRLIDFAQIVSEDEVAGIWALSP